MDGKNNLQFTENILIADLSVDGKNYFQCLIHRENAQFTNCADVSMDRSWQKEIHRRKLHKFSLSVDVSMDGGWEGEIHREFTEKMFTKIYKLCRCEHR